MKTLLLLLIFISCTYAYVEESALANLQTLDHWNTFRIVLSHTFDECFYLETKLEDTIHAIYQVLRGGDSLIRVTITDPLGRTAYTQANSPFGWYDEEHSKVAGVLAIHKDRVLEATINAVNEKKANETAVIEEFSTNAMKLLGNISTTLYRLTAYQTIGRVHHLHDLYTVEANASYVQNWAICQIITMIVCSMIQVFSIRRLFKSTISNKTSFNRKHNENFSPRASTHFILAN
ncbi:unnamed protein product [Rotaria sp. Silwood2]|nr:unnamed protein product [Rotaria sp. Silwood2]CAF3069388.1 unnamed protein product [Rotaria sp. Silwood2]CAF3880994.1 unnamed protein product [Rotaria sp. Silwood2]CAF4164540.1 unnamed protein product [Rotaria sp. Silwood2]